MISGINPEAFLAAFRLDLIKRPLLRAQTVQEILGFSPEAMQERIEDGTFPFAFDIGLKERCRREVRIFSQSVAELAGWKNPAGRTVDFELRQVLDFVLPAGPVRSTELEDILVCSHQTVYTLARKFFRVHQRRRARSGRLAFTLFYRDSIAGFLMGRRLV